jgi:hypothetical protein
MIPLIGVLDPIKNALKHWSKFGKNITFGEPMLNPDFKEFIQSLNDNQVRYLVVGGYAVALHGYPRYTKDIDIWIDATENNSSLWSILLTLIILRKINALLVEPRIWPMLKTWAKR